MLIEIHVIQNHSPANLNRDDLGAPKTCYFGGVLRSRISSQCLKRSIRMSNEFKQLLGGIRTRRLAQLIAGEKTDSPEFAKAVKVLENCGIAPKEGKKKKQENEDINQENLEDAKEDKSAGIVYVSKKAVDKMSELLKDEGKTIEKLAQEFAKLIANETAVPDMALFGRMLEPKKESNKKKDKGKESNEEKSGDIWKGLDRNIEAALQVAHAISTHEARPEVDYFVTVDDVPGGDAGAGYLDEAMFASACFYKYFSINWETLVNNLKDFGNDCTKLAAHTVGAFIQGLAFANPTGKQNSFAAHNPPDGILVEIKNTPTSYANAFAKPVTQNERDIISQSIAQLAQYVNDIDIGYGKPKNRFWFSPNNRFPLNIIANDEEKSLTDKNIESFDTLIHAVIEAIGYNWEDVKNVVVNSDTDL